MMQPRESELARKLVAHKDKLKSQTTQLIEPLLENPSERSICKVKALILEALDVLKKDVENPQVIPKKDKNPDYHYKHGSVEAQLNILRTLFQAINSHSNQLDFLPALKELVGKMASDEYFEKYWHKTHLHWMLVQRGVFCTIGMPDVDGKILDCIFDDLRAGLIPKYHSW